MKYNIKWHMNDSTAHRAAPVVVEQLHGRGQLHVADLGPPTPAHLGQDHGSGALARYGGSYGAGQVGGSAP